MKHTSKHRLLGAKGRLLGYSYLTAAQAVCRETA